MVVKNRKQEIAKGVCSLLTSPHKLSKVKKIGEERMGKPGAAMRVAKLLTHILSKIGL